MFDVFDLAEPRYAAQVFPELHPGEPQPVLSNWFEEDREAYCGIYTLDRQLQLTAEAIERAERWRLIWAARRMQGA